MIQTVQVASESEMMVVAADLASTWNVGTVVYLSGELGAGKTTFVRGVMRSLGWTETVRSPTFNLMQVFPSNPPVLHADLYRLSTVAGVGIEDYLETHLCMVEWPDRMGDLVADEQIWHVHIDFVDSGRRLTVRSPR